MHLPDGLLNNQVSVSLIAVSATVGAYALKKAKDLFFEKSKVMMPQLVTNIGQLNEPKIVSKLKIKFGAKNKFQQMILVVSIIFVAQMIDFAVIFNTPIHLIGGVLAAIVLGPWVGILAMTIVLIVQAVFLSDGGIIALGANIFNMAIIGSLGGYYLYQAGCKLFKNKYLAVAVASWLAVVLAAIFYSIETAITINNALVLAHILAGVTEALITILILRYVFNFAKKN